ncbi:hypothetical protein [Methylobacterium trifolii]|uniref:Zinc ribbon domain-containing protein n=1 Tax=Methylobacterium trifolii TaxID=1003092 RepID=A0ABQ4TU76_9HYPH|nr:hypothetical protein [Methylobacterium trifolii]GJE58616.1 hypothetical protein MPOCJGCO_0698 [Methylobacterium trifolii]
MTTYSCTDCGSPGIKLPADFDDATIVECEGCGRRISTWREFKELAERSIKADAASETGIPVSVSDTAAFMARPMPEKFVITRRALRLRWAGSR